MSPKRIDKNLAIKRSLQETKARRSSLRVIVRTLKIDKSHCSKLSLEYLRLLFLEAKWFYNAVIASENIATFDYKTKNVQVKTKSGEMVAREIRYLSSQMRQAIVDRVADSCKSLNALKTVGKKIGKLKFKSEVRSIPLKQYGGTHKIDKRRLKLQGFKSSFRLCGVKQLGEAVEIANATLIHRDGEYFLAVTMYVQPVKKDEGLPNVGLDFGIKDNITTSDGQIFNVCEPETERSKRLSRSFSRKKTGSRNRLRAKLALSKERSYLARKRKDVRNKIVSLLTQHYNYVCIQDESIKGWQSGLFGKQVQYSAMGGIISDLKQRPETLVVDKWFPSTQLCECCGSLNKHPLSDRVYTCDCGHEELRDIHAAKNILEEGLRSVRSLRNVKMPVEPNPLRSNS